jgi:hypothetical protein
MPGTIARAGKAQLRPLVANSILDARDRSPSTRATILTRESGRWFLCGRVKESK